MNVMKPAVFLDRDGVLNQEASFVRTLEDLNIYPFTSTGLKLLESAGFMRFVITNQSAIARNLLTESGLKAIHNHMQRQFQKSGSSVDAFYYCPHHPIGDFEGAQPEYIQDCDCRKPLPGMIDQAANDFAVDLAKSWLVGDAPRDILAGKARGLRTIGVLTGHGAKGYDGHSAPDFIARDFEEAVGLILKFV
jgi:histidinol-phosphate phosphatase family protein